MVSKPPLTPEELDTREAELTARLARIEELEAQAIRREKAAKEREKRRSRCFSAFRLLCGTIMPHGQRTISAPSTRRLSSF